MSENQWLNLLDLFPEGVFLMNSEGMILFVNRTYEQLTGLRREDIVGRYVRDMKKDNTYVPCIVNGRHLLYNSYSLSGEDGGLTMFIAFIRDINLVDQLMEQMLTQREIMENLQKAISDNEAKPEEAVFAAPQMEALIKSVKKIAKTDASILILGETGVGKDVFARKIHQQSLRRGEPYIKVDCSVIPEALFESELFGYEKGAFTGADKRGKTGLLAIADQGTVFLDEIGEVPLHLQAKLLRFLQDQVFIPIGSAKPKSVNVRIIAATNRDLAKDVASGLFRSDLYYRLRVATVSIPPLRERLEDIAKLSDFFLAKFNSKYHKHVEPTEGLRRSFMLHKWPGNVRELENLIQSLVITNDSGRVGIEALPNYMVSQKSESAYFYDLSVQESLSDLVDAFEKELLLKTLARHGTLGDTASALSIDRSTLFRKMKKHKVLGSNDNVATLHYSIEPQPTGRMEYA